MNVHRERYSTTVDNAQMCTCCPIHKNYGTCYKVLNSFNKPSEEQLLKINLEPMLTSIRYRIDLKMAFKLILMSF